MGVVLVFIVSFILNELLLQEAIELFGEVIRFMVVILAF